MLCCFVWCGACMACGKPPVCQNASVGGAFKTPPCVPGKRPHVLDMRAFSRYTRRRLERTHGGVLNLHTEGFSAFSVFLALSLSLLLFSLSALFSLVSLSLLSSLSSPSLLSSLSATMTMITRPVGSLCVHTALTCECVGVRVLWLIPCHVRRTCSHHARNKHVRIMQETTVLVLLCKPRATWNEVGLYLCWKWVMC